MKYTIENYVKLTHVKTVYKREVGGELKVVTSKLSGYYNVDSKGVINETEPSVRRMSRYHRMGREIPFKAIKP
jgi:hypothetical protein